MPTPKFISTALVLRIHDRQIEKFDGGTPGVRDAGLLESALAQPKATFYGQLLHPTIGEQAAAYLYHLAKNHPFVDGNKRTAFAVMIAFLRVNGYDLAITTDEAYQLVQDVVQGSLSKAELAVRLAMSISLS